ncbi:MAG TPA: hypothetical protein VK002_16145 [Rubricoccaceae bacterium]|nr:hypothetical protein [Rubricoccaceae bacterium]
MRLPLRLGTPLLIGLLLAGTAAAQPSPDTDPDGVVAAVEAAYEQLDYETAEALAREALTHYEAFTPDQLVRLHTLLGLILYARGEELEAAAQFRAALTLDPTLTLDPLLVSPTTIAFFERTKEAFLQEQSAGGSPGGGVRYVTVYDPRGAAFARSLALPGWGQRFKGERTKGWVLTGVWAAGLAASAASAYRYHQVRQAYLDERDPDLIPDRRDTMDTWFKVRNNVLLGTAVVWALIAVEAGITGGPEERMAVGPAPGGASLRLRF